MNEMTPATSPTPVPADTPLGWLRTEIDRLFDDFGRPARNLFNFGASALAPIPALEMTEQDKAYRLTVELPGMKEDEVEVSIADGVLTIAGEKREESERKDEGVLVSERRYGAFRRQLAIPSDVDPQAIAADFDKGVLAITLPKDSSAAERSRKIPIGKG